MDQVDEIAAARGPGSGLTCQVRGFNVDGAVATALPGFDEVVFPSHYGGRVGAGDVGANRAADLLAGPGPDPTAVSTVKSYWYTGASLAQIPISFVAFPGTLYGVNPSAGLLGY